MSNKTKLKSYLNSLGSGGPGMTSTAQTIVDRIRERQNNAWMDYRYGNPNAAQWGREYREQLVRDSLGNSVQEELESEWDYLPPTPDEWQRFKQAFVESVNGETVQASGMTHSEFLDYMRDGTREGAEEWEDWIEWHAITDRIYKRNRSKHRS